MYRKKLYISIIIIFIIIIGVCFYYIYPFETSIDLGLDLKGGTQIILRPTEIGVEEATPEALDKAMLIIMDRVDRLGISEPLITRDYANNIVIQLPGEKDPDRAIEVIGKTAQLEFRVLELEGVFISEEGQPVLLDQKTKEFLFDSIEEKVLIYNLRTQLVEGIVSVDEETGSLVLENLKTGKILGEIKYNKDTDKILIIDTDTQKISGEILIDPETSGTVVLGPTLMTGDRLVNARAGYDPHGKIIVSMSFTSEGQNIFGEITAENIGRQLAIVLDDEIKSAPVIRTEIRGDAVIEGIGSLGEANDIALVLQTGALPVNLEIEESRTVGPTLGRDSLNKGIWAGLIGFSLIIVFMISYYRGLGFVSVISLIVYAVVFWGILAGIKATLTLPGIAGIILTIGMAVDANVIIFERIKEEIRKGKSTRISISEGFRHGMRTIIDANITTLITAAALYRFGMGPIRGFAVTLSLGVIISMVTSLIFTRSILFLMSGLRKVMVPGFLGAKAKEE